MTRAAYRLDRRAALRIAAGVAFAGPLLVPVGRRPRAQMPAAGALDRVSFLTDWRAQAEHGGYYQAIAAGLYRKAGLDAEAFPTDWQVLPAASPWWESLMPSVGALAASGIAIREYLAWAFDYRSVAVKP